jgi:hypothetical protein
MLNPIVVVCIKERYTVGMSIKISRLCLQLQATLGIQDEMVDIVNFEYVVP